MSPTSARAAVGVGALALAFCALSSAPAGASKPIRGKLSKPGYTVIALLTNGRATSARAEKGRFRVPTIARNVSLHLRGPDGSYAGPIVVRPKKHAAGGRKGARAKRGRVILGVKAGAEIGRVAVRRGYARSSRRLPEDSIDRRRTARARNGAPIGARGFGRVRSRPPRKAPADDPDLDGIPDVFDVDDDGDLLLDAQDRGPAKRSSQVSPKGQVSPEDEIFGLFTRLELGLPFTVNANPRSASNPQEPAFDDAEIAAALPRFGHFGMTILPGKDPELDCGGAIQNPPRPEGLIYCRPHSAGGIGELPPVNPTAPGAGGSRPFPDCCDTGVPGDPDGNGSLTATGAPVQGAPLGAMQLLHRATPDQIRPGDVLMQTVTRQGTEIGFLSTLQVIFSTVPAIASYTDTLDDTGAGTPHQVSYPVAPSAPPFPVRDSTADTDQDIEVKLQYWRPQRRAEPKWGERAGDWIDVGQMGYVVQVGFSGARCPADAYTPGPDLSGGPGEPDDPTTSGFSDLSNDRVADPRNTFSFTLNLTRCFTANGIRFSPGDRGSITLVGTTIIGSNELGEPLPVAGGVASQSITFEAQEPAP
jgi:hypothetical protein